MFSGPIRAISFGVLVAAAAVSAGHTDAGLGLALGAPGSVNRVLLAHTRIEESAADQSALRFMNAAKVDPAAMVEVFELFIGQSNLSEEHQDPYTRSHPLNRDRIRTINAYAATRALTSARCQTGLLVFTHSRQVVRISAGAPMDLATRDGQFRR